MLPSDIARRVRATMGDVSSALFLDVDIIDWINDAQEDIARKTNCLEAKQEFNAAVDDYDYALAADFIAARRVEYNGKVLVKTTVEEMDKHHTERNVTISSGTPQVYFIHMGNLNLYPAPSSVGTNNIDLWYSKLPTVIDDLADALDIPRRFHELIVKYCMMRAKELSEEFPVAQLYEGQYNAALTLAMNEVDDPYLDSYPSVRALPGDDF